VAQAITVLVVPLHWLDCSKDHRLPLMASSGVLLSHGWQADEGGCPSGLATLVAQEFQRQFDALDLAEPSLGLGPAAPGQQVCFDLVQAREHPRVYLEDGAAQAGVLVLARYRAGLPGSRVASPRPARTARALPVAPADRPSARAISPGVQAPAGQAAR
jgi:hypothetical protein